MSRIKKYYFILFFGMSGFLLQPGMLNAGGFKVLVIMSYGTEYAWEQEIKAGIKEVFTETVMIKYVYLDTKRYLAEGEKKARKAYDLYQKMKPDGVIAADDNAQSMFVVPYLMNRVSTPVVFCGVNAEAAEYGYPADNVTGILERIHIRNSLAFAQQLVPSIKRFAFISKDSPSAQVILKQFEAQQDTYPAIPVAYKMPKTFDDAVQMTKELKGQSDVLFFETMEGIPDKKGKLYTDKEIIPVLSKVYGKPIISNNLYHVKYGTLCAVIKTGQEQGRKAASMLLKAMQGTPVSQLPITQNREGKRVINLAVMKSLGIKPSSESLRNAQLVGIER